MMFSSFQFGSCLHFYCSTCFVLWTSHRYLVPLFASLHLSDRSTPGFVAGFPSAPPRSSASMLCNPHNDSEVLNWMGRDKEILTHRKIICWSTMLSDLKCLLNWVCCMEGIRCVTHNLVGFWEILLLLYPSRRALGCSVPLLVGKYRSNGFQQDPLGRRFVSVLMS